MPIKYKSTPKEIVLAKIKQFYGLKIVHLLQDNEVTESFPKALKDAKTWELPGAPPLDPTRDCSRYALNGRHFNILPHRTSATSSSYATDFFHYLTGRVIVQHIRPQIMNSSINKVELLHDFSKITI